jgi:hypothetical protein
MDITTETLQQISEQLLKINETIEYEVSDIWSGVGSDTRIYFFGNKIFQIVTGLDPVVVGAVTEISVKEFCDGVFPLATEIQDILLKIDSASFKWPEKRLMITCLLEQCENISTIDPLVLELIKSKYRLKIVLS